MVLQPGREHVAEEIFRKWDLDFAVIGRITDTGRIVVRHKGVVEADIPLDPLADQAPLYRRPIEWPVPAPVLDHGAIGCNEPMDQVLLKLIASPDLCSRAWIASQYDPAVGGQTVKKPGQADAAIVKIEGSNRALAITTDCTPRYCQADPKMGGAQAVAEAWRNITATGARPLAVTDNMNFGNPEKPEIMGQFAAAIQGMAEACRALDFPVVSGNVSLYNETEGKGILPTPAIGGLGVIEDAHQARGIGIVPHLDLVLIGETAGWLGQSLFLREIAGREEGAPPPVNLVTERRNGDFVRHQILNGTVAACHDVSDGGLLVALAEMALAGDCGLALDEIPTGLTPQAFFFGEDQGRYVVAAEDASGLLEAARAAGIPAVLLGRTGGKELTFPGGSSVSLERLREAHERFFKTWMS